MSDWWCCSLCKNRLLYKCSIKFLGDSFAANHNGFKFSTADRDYSNSCAKRFVGAWWYGTTCHFSNLNGKYLNGAHTSFADSINWRTWKEYHYSLKTTEMKVRGYL